MILKNAEGREIEISVSGESDDVQIVEAAYLDSDDEVTEDDIDYLYDHCADHLYNAWHECMLSRADFHERD